MGLTIGPITIIGQQYIQNKSADQPGQHQCGGSPFCKCHACSFPQPHWFHSKVSNFPRKFD